MKKPLTLLVVFLFALSATVSSAQTAREKAQSLSNKVCEKTTGMQTIKEITSDEY